MNLNIYDTSFNLVGVLDVFESSIWTDRYNKAGDFEIYVLPERQYFDLLKPDRYVQREDSEHLMILESNQTISNIVEGSKMIVKGRSLESLLQRRIIWRRTVISGNFQNGIQKLLNENVISPIAATGGANRAMPLIFKPSNDPRITEITIDPVQFTGDNLYDTIITLCEKANLGFKIIYNWSTKRFEFSLYIGEDHSYGQNVNPYVVFSPSFDNLISSDYIEGKASYKNYGLVLGEGEEWNRARAEVGNPNLSGLDRRELYVDARDIQSKVNNGDGTTTTMSDAAYTNALKARGNEKLKENRGEKAFEGTVDTEQMYRYDHDFKMGDIVQFESEFGIQRRTRIIEYIYSESSSECISYPTFEVIDEEE